MLHVLDSPTGIIVNRNESGLTASLLYAMSLYGLLYKKFFSQPINWVILIISLSTSALSFSKGSWLLVLIASFFICSYKFNLIRLSFIICFALVSLLFIPIPEFVFLDAVAERITGSGNTNSIRFQYILDSLKIGTDNLVIGIGPGNYKQHAIANGFDVTTDPHNSYLQSFAELGLLGFLLVLLFYSLSLMKSYFKAKVNENYIIIFVLILLLVADGFQSGLSLTMKLLYILSALAMRKQRIKSNERYQT